MHAHQNIRLTGVGLFVVLGKICYAMELLQAKFEAEDEAPIGVDEALAQLEEAREPLFQLLLLPIDMRDEFVQYMQDEYEITLNLDFALPETKTDTPLTLGKPMMRIVESEKPQ